MSSKERISKLIDRINKLPNNQKEEALSYFYNFIGSLNISRDWFDSCGFKVPHYNYPGDYFFTLLKTTLEILDKESYFTLLDKLDRDITLRTVFLENLKSSKNLFFYDRGTDYVKAIKKMAEINYKVLTNILEHGHAHISSKITRNEMKIIGDYVKSLFELSEESILKTILPTPVKKVKIIKPQYSPTNLPDPRQFTEEKSVFLNDDPPSKFYETMTIVLALKKDFKLLNEKKLEVDQFILKYRIDYLLKKLGFTNKDIPFFVQIQDNEPYLEYMEEDGDLEYRDLEDNYYFLWVDSYNASIIWKLSDFIYSTQNTTKHIEIIPERINLVGDTLILLTAVFGDTC